MIANRKQDNTRSTRLLAVAATTVLLLAWSSPASASKQSPSTLGDTLSQLLASKKTDASEKVSARKKKSKKKKLSNEAAWKKATGIPMLPSLPHFLAKVMPEKAGVIHKYEWVWRPIYAFIIVGIMFILLQGMYRKRAVLPTRLQAAMEMIVEGLDNLICGILGEKYGRAYLPYLGALFLYIVCLNWFGQIPLMFSPTSYIACTGALAICTFCVVQYTQFTKLGIKGVVHHWAGEPKDIVGYCVAILLIPLHLVEEVIKPLSLALRLFGNIYGEDVLLGSMIMLGIMAFSFLPANGIPLGLPLVLPFQFLALLLSTIQALVFTLLSTIYILMILPHDDHDEEHAESHA